MSFAVREELKERRSKKVEIKNNVRTNKRNTLEKAQSQKERSVGGSKEDLKAADWTLFAGIVS